MDIIARMVERRALSQCRQMSEARRSTARPIASASGLNGGMRASNQEQKGGIGAHEVAADFERIGWGAAENSKHDLGTDLFLMARDHRLIDLGMVVGAQVKAGPTYFEEVVSDEDGNVTGWWFRESRRDHFDAWLTHQLPHLIVLHDIDTRRSYWAHITAKTVEYTDKGAKVFVPADNVVNATNADKLLAVAGSNTSRVNWEGSAWAGAVLSPSHQLRHALLAPRLIAPHPNRGKVQNPTAAQVVAMLVQGRLRDIARLREQHSSMPDLDALAADAPWDWTFAASARKFLTTGDPDVFKPIVDTSRPPHEQAAATVAYAAALLEDGRADEAVDVLDVLLGRDELELVDHAWVQLQHARALSELGHRQQARDEALGLVRLAERAPGDVTAAAIGGAAANTVFAVSDWESHDLETVISVSDTTAAWWRQQVSSWGLSAQSEKLFQTWGRDDSVVLVAEDEAWRYLRSASLLAGLLGDHSAWRHTTRQLATYQLSDRDHGEDPSLVAQALTTLRYSGDYKGLQLAVRRVVSDGPAIAARTAAVEVKPENSTHTSAHADLKMLIGAADLLPPDRAEALADWAQRVFLDPSEYLNRTHPNFILPPTLVDLMSALVDSVGTMTQCQLADFVLHLPVQSDQGTADRLGRLVQRLPSTVWTPERAQRAADLAGDTSEFSYALLGVAQAHVPEASERLKAEAHDGSLMALSALGDITALDIELVKSLVASLTSRIETQIQDAMRGTYRSLVLDLGRAITILNVWHPEAANWDIVYRLLTVRRYGDYLAGALDLMANMAADLPDDVASELLPLVEAIAAGSEPRAFLVPVGDPRPPAHRLLAMLKHRAGEPSFEHLSALARGNLDARCAAALLARGTSDDLSMGTLIALAGDPHPRVRAIAGRVIAERAASGDAVARTQLRFLVEDRGVLVPQAVAAAAVEYPQLTTLDELRPLGRHISARVRATFASS